MEKKICAEPVAPRGYPATFGKIISKSYNNLLLVNTQHAIRNTQYAIRNAQYAIRNTQYAIRNTQHATRNTQ